MTERAFETIRTPPWGWPLDFRHVIMYHEEKLPPLIALGVNSTCQIVDSEENRLGKGSVTGCICRL